MVDRDDEFTQRIRAILKETTNDIANLRAYVSSRPSTMSRVTQSNTLVSGDRTTVISSPHTGRMDSSLSTSSSPMITSTPAPAIGSPSADVGHLRHSLNADCSRDINGVMEAGQVYSYVVGSGQYSLSPIGHSVLLSTQLSPSQRGVLEEQQKSSAEIASSSTDVRQSAPLSRFGTAPSMMRSPASNTRYLPSWEIRSMPKSVDRHAPVDIPVADPITAQSSYETTQSLQATDVLDEMPLRESKGALGKSTFSSMKERITANGSTNSSPVGGLPANIQQTTRLSEMEIMPSAESISLTGDSTYKCDRDSRRSQMCQPSITTNAMNVKLEKPGRSPVDIQQILQIRDFEVESSSSVAHADCLHTLKRSNDLKFQKLASVVSIDQASLGLAMAASEGLIRSFRPSVAEVKRSNLSSPCSKVAFVEQANLSSCSMEKEQPLKSDESVVMPCCALVETQKPLAPPKRYFAIDFNDTASSAMQGAADTTDKASRVHSYQHVPLHADGHSHNIVENITRGDAQRLSASLPDGFPVVVERQLLISASDTSAIAQLPPSPKEPYVIEKKFLGRISDMNFEQLSPLLTEQVSIDGKRFSSPSFTASLPVDIVSAWALNKEMPSTTAEDSYSSLPKDSELHSETYFYSIAPESCANSLMSPILKNHIPNNDGLATFVPRPNVHQFSQRRTIHSEATIGLSSTPSVSETMIGRRVTGGTSSESRHDVVTSASLMLQRLPKNGKSTETSLVKVTNVDALNSGQSQASEGSISFPDSIYDEEVVLSQLPPIVYPRQIARTNTVSADEQIHSSVSSAAPVISKRVTKHMTSFPASNMPSDTRSSLRKIDLSATDAIPISSLKYPFQSSATKSMPAQASLIRKTITKPSCSNEAMQSPSLISSVGINSSSSHSAGKVDKPPNQTNISDSQVRAASPISGSQITGLEIKRVASPISDGTVGKSLRTSVHPESVGLERWDNSSKEDSAAVPLTQFSSLCVKRLSPIGQKHLPLSASTDSCVESSEKVSSAKDFATTIRQVSPPSSLNIKQFSPTIIRGSNLYSPNSRIDEGDSPYGKHSSVIESKIRNLQGHLMQIYFIFKLLFYTKFIIE